MFVYYGTSDLVKNITFKELYTKWVDYKREYILVRNTKKRLSPNTIRRYENDYDYFFKGHPIENMVITNITTNILTDTFKELIDVKLPTASNISRASNRRGKEVGIEKVSVHRVRRTVSSQLNYILPRKDVATLLGHSEKVNEEHYDYSLAEIQAKKQALSQVSVNIINFSDLVTKKKLKESV